MKTLIAAICFMFALSPLAWAQTKVDDKKAPSAAEKKVAPATDMKSLPAEKKSASAPAEKKAAPAAKAKKQPSEKQLAQQAKMKSCSKDASDKKLKGDERKTFMSGCMKG